jgi:hypothetical protein
MDTVSRLRDLGCSASGRRLAMWLLGLPRELEQGRTFVRASHSQMARGIGHANSLGAARYRRQLLDHGLIAPAPVAPTAVGRYDISQLVQAVAGG